MPVRLNRHSAGIVYRFVLKALRINPICIFLCVFFSGPLECVAHEFVLSLSPGISWYAMRDMNRLMESTPTGWMQITPSETMSPLGLGLNFDSSLHYCLTSNFLAGLDFAYLVTDSSAKVNASAIFPPQVDYYKISLPAFEWGASVKGVLPINNSFQLTVGAGLSWISLVNAGESYEARSKPSGLVFSSSRILYQGAGISTRLTLGLDWMVWEWFSLGIEGGYRMAKITTIKAIIRGEETTLTLPDHSNLTVDYSGPFLVYAFRFYF